MRYSQRIGLDLAFAILFVCASPQLSAQGLVDSLADYLNAFRTEKVYVSHDKPHYAPGETIWCSVRLVDGGSHRVYPDATPLVYIDWIDPGGSVLRSYTLQLKDGFAPLDIATLPNADPGVYTLRAYSRYQRNFADDYLFQKEIRLLNFAGQADTLVDAEAREIAFFPEGGQLVTGVSSTVAFRARNARGDNLALRGQLIDETGRKLTDVLTLHEGIGIFKLRPEAGKSYFLRTRVGEELEDFPLPAALPRGYLLAASARSVENIQLKVAASPGLNLRGTTLVGQVRGNIVLRASPEAGGRQEFTLRRSDLPSGVIHFTLFDPQSRPVSERLVFNKHPERKPALDLSQDKPFYDRRAPVELSLETDEAASYSISVFDAALGAEGANDLTIESYLLLQSDLRGRINNIQQYFAADDARTNSLLDLLMLTHGWRKFSWLDALAGRLPDLLYPPEEHLSIAGKVTRYERDKAVRADVQLNVLSLKSFAALEGTTEEDGIFVFRGFDFTDTTDIVLQASTHNERVTKKRDAGEIGRTGNRYVDIELLTLDSLPFNEAVSVRSRMARPQSLRAYAYEVASALREDAPGGSEWSIDLQEVTVTSGLNRATLREKKIKERMREKGLFYFGGTPKFLADDPQFDGFRKETVFELIKLIVPRAQLTVVGGQQRLIYGSLSGGVQPLIVVDGVIVSQAAVRNLNPDDIAVIDVLEGYFAKLYSDDDPVVISLVTKREGEIERPNPGMLSIVHPGYYQAREFYAPDYSAASENGKKDGRTTLYWHPNLRTDRSEGPIRFFTGDRPGEYRIRVEGLSDNGVPFYRGGLLRVR